MAGQPEHNDKPRGELTVRISAMPGDTNANGDIFGGWVMAQVDLAGAVLPARLMRGRMATVAVNQFIFKQPVKVGDILSCTWRDVTEDLARRELGLIRPGEKLVIVKDAPAPQAH